MPPFDAGMPAIKTVFTGSYFELGSTLNTMLRTPQYARLYHMSGLELEGSLGLTIDEFVETVNVLTNFGLPPHPDELSVPERVAVRHGGSRDNAPALLIGELSCWTPVEPARHRSTVMTVLRSIGKTRNFDPRTLKIGGLKKFSADEITNALIADSMTTQVASTVMGRFNTVLREWDIVLAA